MEFFLQYELCFYYYHIFSFVYLQNSSSYKNLNPNFDQEMSIFPIKFITMKQTPPPPRTDCSIHSKMDRIYRKLIPYFLVTCGECIEATDSRSGTSFADKLRAVVTVLREQNSVASKNAASVSDCR